jgi:hypothetical protein
MITTILYFSLILVVVERFHRVLGDELIAGRRRVERPGLLDIGFFHLTGTEGDACASVVIGDDVAVAEEDLGDIVLDLDEYELPFIHLMGKIVTDISVNDVEVGGLGAVFIGKFLRPVGKHPDKRKVLEYQLLCHSPPLSVYTDIICVADGKINRKAQGPEGVENNLRYKKFSFIYSYLILKLGSRRPFSLCRQQGRTATIY